MIQPIEKTLSTLDIEMQLIHTQFETALTAVDFDAAKFFLEQHSQKLKVQEEIGDILEEKYAKIFEPEIKNGGK